MTLRIALNGSEKFFVKSGILRRLFVFFVAQSAHVPAEEISVLARGSRGHILNDLGSDEEVDVNVLACIDSLD